ncbi:MAG: hypothetical protein AAFQ82_23335, partial [Myxococcota bacterium]
MNLNSRIQGLALLCLSAGCTQAADLNGTVLGYRDFIERPGEARRYRFDSSHGPYLRVVDGHRCETLSLAWQPGVSWTLRKEPETWVYRGEAVPMDPETTHLLARCDGNEVQRWTVGAIPAFPSVGELRRAGRLEDAAQQIDQLEKKAGALERVELEVERARLAQVRGSSDIAAAWSRVSRAAALAHLPTQRSRGLRAAAYQHFAARETL